MFILRNLKNNLIDLRSLLLFSFHKIFFNIFFLFNKNKILVNNITLVQYEGGYGHTIHDPVFFKMYYKPEKISLILFYDKKRHNKYVKNIFKGISYFNFPVFFLDFEEKKKLSDYVKNYLRKNTNLKIVKDYRESVIEIIDNKENDYLPNVPRNNHHHWTAIFANLLKDYDQNDNISVDDIVFRKVEKKIGQYFSKHEIESKKIITVYLKQKTVLNNIFSGLSLEEWKKILNKLSEQYNIFLFGDYNSIDQYNLNKNIIYSERIKLNQDIWSLYASMKNDFFIGENGAPIYVAVIKKKNILVLNSYPWTYAQPDSIFVPKFINLKNTKHNKISEIFEKYSFFPDPGIYPDVLNSQLTDRIIQRFLKGDYNDKNNAINPKEKFNLHKFSLFNLVDCRIPKDWYDQYNL